jgi:hypothetical protein
MLQETVASLEKTIYKLKFLKWKIDITNKEEKWNN